MDDLGCLEPDELARLRTRMRFASFAVPSLVAVLNLMICWRRHFDKTSIEGAVFSILIVLYLANFLSRRSRGLSASLGYVSVRADSDEGLYGSVDVVALWASVAFVGLAAYILFKCW